MHASHSRGALHPAAQMRFPTALAKPDGAGEWRLAAHHATLLDGEMVVDESLASGEKTRRYLAYDCMAVNGKSLAGRPWKVLHSPPLRCPAAALTIWPCKGVAQATRLCTLFLFWKRQLETAGGAARWPARQDRQCSVGVSACDTCRSDGRPSRRCCGCGGRSGS